MMYYVSGSGGRVRLWYQYMYVGSLMARLTYFSLPPLASSATTPQNQWHQSLALLCRVVEVAKSQEISL